MGIEELIGCQQQDGIIRLLRQGLFFRGYNEGALMLKKLMGYKVCVSQVKSSEEVVCFAGFPSVNMNKVLEKVRAHGGSVVEKNKNTIEISGLEYPCDRQTIASYSLTEKQPKRNKATIKEKEAECSLLDAVRNFDLENATPIRAILFVGELKKLIGDVSAKVSSAKVSDTPANIKL